MIDPSKIAATGEEAPDTVAGGDVDEEPTEGESGQGEPSVPEEEGGKDRRRRPKREE